MSPLERKNSTETVSDALWMGLLAGLGGVFIVLIPLGGLYLFDPIGKLIIERQSSYILATLAAIFVAGFGFSLQFTLSGQFWRGKLK